MQRTTMELIGIILLSAGTISVWLGYLGIVFCGFSLGIGRGFRNFLFPILGFGDAMRRFHWLIWLWGGGIALIALGGFFV
jgi:hypothetical protein